MQNKISQTIGRLRRERGLTQEALGAMFGISGQAVSKWENGESMPDILLLPELCDILGISVGKLLGQSEQDVMNAFVETARRNGRTKMLYEAVTRLFGESGDALPGQNVVWGKGTVRVSEDGMGFLLTGEESMASLLAMEPSETAYFFRILADEACLAVLRCFSIDTAVTEAEIRAQTGLDEAVLDRILLGMMKRNLIACEADASGKRGYLQSAGMIGVYMALAGCRVVGENGSPCGNFWSSRREIPY